MGDFAHAHAQATETAIARGPGDRDNQAVPRPLAARSVTPWGQSPTSRPARILSSTAPEDAARAPIRGVPSTSTSTTSTACRVRRAVGAGPSPASTNEQGTRIRRSIASTDDLKIAPSTERIQRRDSTFVPFKAAGRAKQNVTIAGLALDDLIETGLQYPEGGTQGNSVNLEKMVQDNGGGSAPGEPVEFGRFRMLHAPLVRAHNQQNCATAMHAINHTFADPIQTNERPENIFMGSARSNTQLHFNKVELQIRNSMKRATSGAAAQYEFVMANFPPTPCTQDPNILLWDSPGTWIPGVDVHTTPITGPQAAPLAQATHSIDLTNHFSDVSWDGWPKIIQYTVTPIYGYPAHPAFPQFLLDNIADTEQDIQDEQNGTSPNLALVTAVTNAVARLKVIGQDMFPNDFTCTAIYWFPSYDPAQMWWQSTDHDIYSAEL